MVGQWPRSTGSATTPDSVFSISSHERSAPSTRPAGNLQHKCKASPAAPPIRPEIARNLAPLHHRLLSRPGVMKCARFSDGTGWCSRQCSGRSGGRRRGSLVQWTQGEADKDAPFRLIRTWQRFVSRYPGTRRNQAGAHWQGAERSAPDSASAACDRCSVSRFTRPAQSTRQPRAPLRPRPPHFFDYSSKGRRPGGPTP